jgi:N-methylhydantoinase B
VRFEPEPNTITCASWPSPMSAGPSTAVHLTMKQSTQALNRMLLTAPELEGEVLCWGSVSQWPLMSVEGRDRNGEYYGSSILEPMIGGTGARRRADGVDSGGHTWDPKSSGANAEENELFFPILYLSRSELPDSGGAGQFRGGNTVVTRFVPHGTDGINHSLTSSSQESPATSGVAGAFPGAPNRVELARDSEVQRLMAKGVLPTSMDEVGGRIERIPAKARDFFQTPDDVYEFIYNGGTGLGDPLKRDPAAVADDVSEGSASPWAARELYRVVLEQVGDHEWLVDEAATRTLRQDALAERLELPLFNRGSVSDATVDPDVPVTQLLLALGLAELDDRHVTVCTDCRGVVAPEEVNYKEQSRFEELPLRETNPYFLEGRTFLDVEFVLRRYFCPHCGSLFDVEVCESGAPPFRDVALDLSGSALSAR